MKARLLGIRLLSALVLGSLVFSPFSAFAQEIPESTPAEPASSESVFNLEITPETQEESLLPEIPSDLPESISTSPMEESGLLETEESLLDSGDEGYLGGLNGQHSAETRQALPESDLSTGALTYKYPIQIPPGRKGVQPDISLTYNNQEASNISNIFGFGWSVSVPYIERVNKTGVEDLYLSSYGSVSFRSSLSGELVRISSGSYGPKIDTSDFFRYTLASNSWSLIDKEGTGI